MEVELLCYGRDRGRRGRPRAKVYVEGRYIVIYVE